jgi:hypothetical protein
MKCIAYTRLDGGVSVIHPAPEFKDQIEMIADKDTPAVILYKIIDTNDLPSRETRSAWVLNLTEETSDGKGLTKEEFETKYPELKGWAVQ